MVSKQYELDIEIHVWRAKKRMTQQQLADFAGASRQTIMQLEKNKYNPSLMLAYTIAEILDAQIEELFSFAEEERKNDWLGLRVIYK